MNSWRRAINLSLTLALLLAATLLVTTGATVANAQATCEGSAESRLAVGMKAVVTPGDPNALWSDWKSPMRRVGEMEAGTTMEILGGPECRNGTVWWRVRSDEDDVVGWTGEGRDEDYWLEPVQTASCADAIPSRLAVGMKAVVTPGDPNALWSDWKSPMRRVGEMEAGTTMEILGGPECRNRTVWWRVRSDEDEVVGWTGEGRDEDYWLEPVQDNELPTSGAVLIQGQTPIGLEALRNSTYQSWYTESGEAQLIDGRFTTTLTFEDGDYQPEAGMVLTDHIAEGDLNGDGIPDAAAVLMSMTAQTTGRFYTLHAMLGQVDGSYSEAGNDYLGDRVRIESVAIQADGTIVVDTVASGPNDPMMGPSVRVVYTFSLWSNGPAPLSAVTSCPGGLESRLMSGVEAQVLTGDPSSLWSDWQTGASRTRVERLPAGSIMTVLDGPECRNGYTWWNVEIESGATGWIAEGRVEEGYFLAPTTTLSPLLPVNSGLVLTAFHPPTCDDEFESQLMPGFSAQVSPGDSSTLWSDWQASSNRRRLATLTAGSTISVLRGPECRNDYTWWEVETADGARGWMAEGRVGEEAYLLPVAESATAAHAAYLETVLNGGAWTIPYTQAPYSGAEYVASTLLVEQLPPLRDEAYFLTYTQGWLGENPLDYAPSLVIWRAEGVRLQMASALNADWYTIYHGDSSLGRYALSSVETVLTDAGAFFVARGFIDNTVPTVDFIYESEFGLIVDFGVTHGIGGDITGEVHAVGPERYGYVAIKRFRTANINTGATLYLYSSESGEYEPALTLSEAGDYTFEFLPHPSQPYYDLSVAVRDAGGTVQFEQQYHYEEGEYVASTN